MSNPNGGPQLTFHTNEEMIQNYEKLTNVPVGSIKFLDVLESPTFPWPDGKEYRIIPKRYPVVSGRDGRSLPLEFERIAKR
jgi:hypothetical protein